MIMADRRAPIKYALQRLSMLLGNAAIRRSGDAGAQIDLIGAPWLMISEEPSATPNGGSVSALPELGPHLASH